MPATRDGKLWRSQFYYKDWQGIRRKKNKRGFKTKGEADEWERNFLQQQQKNLDISFENFVEITKISRRYLSVHRFGYRIFHLSQTFFNDQFWLHLVVLWIE